MKKITGIRGSSSLCFSVRYLQTTIVCGIIILLFTGYKRSLDKQVGTDFYIKVVSPTLSAWISCILEILTGTWNCLCGIKLDVVSLTQHFHIAVCLFCWSLTTGESRFWLNFSCAIILWLNTEALAYGLTEYLKKSKICIYYLLLYLYIFMCIYTCVCAFINVYLFTRLCMYVYICLHKIISVGAACKNHFQFCFPAAMLSPGQSKVCYEAIFLLTLLEKYSSWFNQGWSSGRWWVNHPRSNTECW